MLVVPEFHSSMYVKSSLVQPWVLAVSRVVDSALLLTVNNSHSDLKRSRRGENMTVRANEKGAQLSM